MAQPQEKPSQSQPVDQTPDQLIRSNGTLVENLFTNEGWVQIAEPLIAEYISGVSGRKTNGRYHHGTLTRDWSANTSVFVAGYQKGLMDFYNGLNDFIAAKNNLNEKVKVEAKVASAPFINPFMEEDGYEIS